MKNKTFEEKLADLKRSNKARKLYLATQAGYSTVENYNKWLEGNIFIDGGITITRDKPTIHNVYIVDRSGSMRSKIANALNGINEEINILKQDNNTNWLQTIVYFDSRIIRAVDAIPIKDVPIQLIYVDSYTKLYQAIGETLEHILKTKGEEKVLVKIFTDGEENDSSGKYCIANYLKSFIKECEKVGFTITFVGEKNDIKDVVKKLGLEETNTLSHNNTPEDITRVFNESKMSTVRYASEVSRGLDVSKGFYKREGTL